MSVIKVGIDAKWYFDGPPSGKMVVVNLVDNLLSQKDVLVEFHLFINKSHEKLAKQNPLFVNAKLIFIHASPNLLSNLFLIPYWAKKLQLDIVLFQNFAATWPKKTKRIAYIHDVLFYDYPQFYSKKELAYFKPMGYLAGKANAIVTISHSEEARLIAHHVASADKITVVHHGLNHQFKPIEEYSKEEIQLFNEKYKLPEKYLLYVGRINIRKNLLNLLKAFEYIDDSSIRLVIVGKDDHKNVDIRSYIQSKGLSDRIIFTGHLPDNDLYLVYARCKVFCFPSYAEGFGLPPLEAMRCAIPVIVAHNTSLPEVCGGAAEYIDPDSPESIAQKINLLWGDSSLYNLKKEQCYQWSLNFSWELAAQKLLNIFRNAS